MNLSQFRFGPFQYEPQVQPSAFQYNRSSAERFTLQSEVSPGVRLQAEVSRALSNPVNVRRTKFHSKPSLADQFPSTRGVKKHFPSSSAWCLSIQARFRRMSDFQSTQSSVECIPKQADFLPNAFPSLIGRVLSNSAAFSQSSNPILFQTRPGASQSKCG